MRGFQVVGSRNQIKREGDLSWHGMNHNEQKITRLKFPALQVTKRSFLFLICFHVVGLSFFHNYGNRKSFNYYHRHQ